MYTYYVIQKLGTVMESQYLNLISKVDWQLWVFKALLHLEKRAGSLFDQKKLYKLADLYRSGFYIAWPTILKQV